MSADNYYYVRPCPDGQWTFTMEFMSEEEPREIRASDPRFPTWREAFKGAADAEKAEPYGSEYGIICDPSSEDVPEPYERHCATCRCEKPKVENADQG